MPNPGGEDKPQDSSAVTAPEAPVATRTPHFMKRRNRLIGTAALSLVIVAVGAKAITSVTGKISKNTAEIAELGDKLERTQDRLDDTTHTLHITESQLKATRKRQAKQETRAKRLADIVAQDTNSERKTVEGVGLKSVSSLPGFGKHSDKEEKHRKDKQLRNSLLVVLARDKGNDGEWRPICSANRVAEYMVGSAAHCLEFSYSLPKKAKIPKAADVTEVDTREYAIANPHFYDAQDYSSSKPSKHFEPIAYVEAASVATPNFENGTTNDLALLKVRPVTPPEDVRPFKEASILPLLENNAKPIRGESVVFYAEPMSVSKTVVKRHVRYVGDMNVGIQGKKLERPSEQLVSTAYQTKNDNGRPGGSGSFGIGLLSGHIYGGMTGRLPKAMQEGMAKSKEWISGDLEYRLYEEKELGLDLSPYRTILSTAKHTTNLIKNLKKGLDTPVLSFAKRVEKQD